LDTINEFDFEIRYIKGKENRVADALSMQIQVNHLASIRSYGIDLQDRILQGGQQDVRYMEIVHRLQQVAGTSTGDSIGIGTGAIAQDMDYFLALDGLMRLEDMIYVLDRSELKKVILREFHVKPYSGHPGFSKDINCSEEVLLLVELEEGCSRVCG